MLVKVNNYNFMHTRDLLKLWLTLNERIRFMIDSQSAKTLAYEIVLDHNEISDLKYLMTDYVDHMEHHLNKIFNE